MRVDAYAGARAAAKHLVDLGHRRFGILSFLRTIGPARVHPVGKPRAPEDSGLPIDQEKYRAYADALAEVGVDIGDVPMVQAEAWDREAAGMMLDAAPDATAVLSMGVMQAIALIEEARRRGISVPRDLSVVGYNDFPDAERCNPPLTTVDAMGIQKGRAAARMVFAGGPPRHEIIEPRLIVRGSTGPVPERS